LQRSFALVFKLD